MTERERARGVVYLTAQAVKAFLEAFDPLEDALGDLIRAGYTVQILVTAQDQAAPGDPITYLIEMDRKPGEDDREWSPEDQAFLRDLRVKVAPDERPGQGQGEVSG